MGGNSLRADDDLGNSALVVVRGVGSRLDWILRMAGGEKSERLLLLLSAVLAVAAFSVLAVIGLLGILIPPIGRWLDRLAEKMEGR